ncbi:MAG: GYD domain-containing protein [candidate division WOR-3 bacterium]|nr:GYD domain-containing protein [candidate division WOR-3 bacterium]
MTFITMLDVIPGRADELLNTVKNLKIPEGVKIKEFLSLFGKPDYILIFEAPDEEKAMNFILKFVAYAVPKTSLGVRVEYAHE